MTAALLALMLSAAGSPACEAEQPFPTTIKAIAEEPERFVGMCVCVVGYSDGRSLFVRPSDVTVRSIRQNGALRRDEMIGVYDLPTLPQTTVGTRVKWTLVGKVDLCSEIYRRARKEADAEANEDEIRIVMMAGYCHYLGGPVLLVTDAKVAIPNDER